MWDRLNAQIAVQREQLGRLLQHHPSLLQKCTQQAPDAIERSALAAMLHSFYTGVENIFKRVAIECDGGAPAGDTWHRDLLDAMTLPTPQRPAVISEDLRNALRKYLNFRHVFRQAYSFELRWEKMSPLVLECEPTWQRLDAELQAFTKRLQEGG